jgi:phosphate transport system substrate-binding protein
MRRRERSKRRIALAAVAALTVAGSLGAQAVKVDAALPAYQPTSGVSGSLKSIGSDTMNNEMTLWGEAFRKFYPNVKIEIEGKGSGTAPPALTAGTSQFGPMSRPMKDAEIDAFEKQFGYKPTQIRTSLDALAVYVNKDNPLECLTLQKVDAVFSKARRGGYAKDVKTWGDLGLTGEWAARPISLYGRNSASGTYGYFKEHALFNGDFKDTVKEQPGSSSVVQGVASDRYAIGYSGIGYKTADVRAVPIAARDGDECHPADIENVYNGRYPLWRYLMLYVNRKPGEPLDPLREQFLMFVLSRAGQEIVVKDGYLPLNRKIVDEEIAKLK